MNAKQYTESIKIETKEEYQEYQEMVYNSVKDGLTNNKDTVDLTWKGETVTIDLNHSSFLIGYNYGITTTLLDIQKEKESQEKSQSGTN